MKKEDSSFEDDAFLTGEPKNDSSCLSKKKLLILIISIISVVLVVLIITLSVVLTRKKSNSSTEKDPPADVSQIIFHGADDIEIMQGKYFNTLENVKALTQDGKDYTSRITVSGEINTAKEGNYQLLYQVTDDNQNSFEKVRNINVAKNPEIGKEVQVPTYSIENDEPFNIAKGCQFLTNSRKDLAPNALDGNYGTRWESEFKDDIYFGVDLGKILTVNQVKIYWEAAYAAKYDLQKSNDGKTWETIETVENPKDMPYEEKETDSGTKKEYINLFDFTESDKILTTRFLRVNCHKRITEYGYSIYEFEVIGQLGTVIPIEYYPDLFNAQNDRAPDWSRPNSQWVEFDLGETKTINRARLAFENYLFPNVYQVFYKADGGEYQQAILKNMPYSGDTFYFAENQNSETRIDVSARFFKIEMDSTRFQVSCYRILEINLKYEKEGEETVEHKISSGSASTSKEGHGIELAFDGNDKTYWENANDVEYQEIDLKSVKPIGRVDLYWRGDDGGKGKYYDLEISSDHQTWQRVFRQTHGATPIQKVYVYEECRYIRFIDYQSPSSYQFMLEGAVVHSQLPASSGEGKVKYDVNIQFPKREVVKHGSGSYIKGGTNFPCSRLIAYLDESLRGKPVPSNGWWQGILVRDKGYNMFMNPLTATFKQEGLWITYPGKGYFDGFNPGGGSQTVNVDVSDIAIGVDEMNGQNAEVRVIGYSDYGVSVVMSDNPNIDKMMVFLSQGSLYAYCLFAEPEKALITADYFVKVTDIDGNEILGNDDDSFTNDSIVVVVRTHSGYVGDIMKYRDSDGKVFTNDKLFEDRYYVVSAPSETLFTRKENKIFVNMTNGNYLSLGVASYKNTFDKDGVPYSTQSKQFPKEEVALLHEHGYAFVQDTNCEYSFDPATNDVKTHFRLKTMLVRENFSSDAYSVFLPHHLHNYNCDDGYIYPSIRGNCRTHIGNHFEVIDKFQGIVPTFSEPNNKEYDTNALYDLLNVIYKGVGGDKPPSESNLISGDPYWQGKNLHPMSMAAIAADQIGAIDMRDAFLDKIEYILEDWFTYDEEKDESTGAYFYYDDEWGTIYYKHSEFGAGVNLADHYFTYGYYLLAAGILTNYRHEFAEKWGSMVELLIRDYMNPSHDDDMFPYMRNFDCFAGHGWAGGYADNNGGNNQESAGEALNSWLGAYFYATAVGNQRIRDAAIYGYTTELLAIKHYWFNYFGDFLDKYPFGSTGQVYGGSSFYGTFFNGQPLYVYGIHLIPGQEYLTSFGIDQSERKSLRTMIEKLRQEQGNWGLPESESYIYAWQHIFIPIVAIYDPDEAINWYKECVETIGGVRNDNEQFNVYWIINGLKSTGFRTTEIWAENGMTSTVYVKDNSYKAICWNPTNETVRFVFKNKDGIVGSANIQPKALVTVDPTKVTDSFLSYSSASDFAIDAFYDSENAQFADNKVTINSNGKVTYRLAFGVSQVYRHAVITCNSNENALHMFIDDVEIPLIKTESGYESDPFIKTFKHEVTLKSDGIEISEFKFVDMSLVKSEVRMTATSTSVNNEENTPDKAVDGDIKTRWESKAVEDGVELVLTLDQQTLVYQLQIHWEAASAKEYKVLFAETENNFVEVFNGGFNGGARTDIISPSQIMNVKFIKIECVHRSTDYGYSIYEVELYNFD